jgi:formylglycine-generating enzyme required for sulfatase activity
VKGIISLGFPVENVSWEEAQEFIKKLTELEEKAGTGLTYRLPTEAEWEYACRGGAASSKPFNLDGQPTDCLSSKDANFNGNHSYGGADKGDYLQRTCEVGSHKPNGYGLCDMHGNVWEWCADWYGKDYYSESPRQDPQGPKGGSRRVFRGGSWHGYGSDCRASSRGRDAPSYRLSSLGFRLAADPSGE